MIHWAAKYIGMKYTLGSRGPNEVDCWGLLYLIYRREFHIELPEFPGIALADLMVIRNQLREAIQTDWVEVEKPFDGAAVAMSQRATLHHVGIYVRSDGGKVLHGWDGRGVVADTISDLRLKGFRVIRFFKHKTWPV